MSKYSNKISDLLKYQGKFDKQIDNVLVTHLDDEQIINTILKDIDQGIKLAKQNKDITDKRTRNILDPDGDPVSVADQLKGYKQFWKEILSNLDKE